jgi:hypothetical protein
MISMRLQSKIHKKTFEDNNRVSFVLFNKTNISWNFSPLVTTNILESIAFKLNSTLAAVTHIRVQPLCPCGDSKGNYKKVPSFLPYMFLQPSQRQPSEQPTPACATNPPVLLSNTKTSPTTQEPQQKMEHIQELECLSLAMSLSPRPYKILKHTEI